MGAEASTEGGGGIADVEVDDDTFWTVPGCRCVYPYHKMFDNRLTEYSLTDLAAFKSRSDTHFECAKQSAIETLSQRTPGTKLQQFIRVLSDAERKTLEVIHKYTVIRCKKEDLNMPITWEELCNSDYAQRALAGAGIDIKEVGDRALIEDTKQVTLKAFHAFHGYLRYLLEARQQGRADFHIWMMRSLAPYARNIAIQTVERVMRIPGSARQGWCTAGGEEGPMGTPPVKRSEMIQALKMRVGAAVGETVILLALPHRLY